MKRQRGLVWWYWLLTGVALGASLAGGNAGLTVAIALTTLAGIHLGLRSRSMVALPVQVRAAYLGLLLLGSWPPLRALHWMQLAGTAVVLVFDYCVLARLLSLLPWNRRAPLTRARLLATFLSPPVRGSVAAALDRADDVHVSVLSRARELPLLR
jgi:hypothetical protein